MVCRRKLSLWHSVVSLSLLGRLQTTKVFLPLLRAYFPQSPRSIHLWNRSLNQKVCLADFMQLSLTVYKLLIELWSWLLAKNIQKCDIFCPTGGLTGGQWLQSLHFWKAPFMLILRCFEVKRCDDAFPRYGRVYVAKWCFFYTPLLFHLEMEEVPVGGSQQ